MRKSDRVVVTEFFRALNAGAENGLSAQWPTATHRYQCPATRDGRTVRGICDCGGSMREYDLNAATLALKALIQ